MYAIEVDKISKLFGDSHAIKNLSFKVEQGHIHGLLGPNGSGKTTTMRIIAKLLSSDEGQVFINESCLLNYTSALYKDIGILLEEPPLYSDMYVEEYLRFVIKLKGVDSSVHDEYVKSTLEQLDLLEVRNRIIGNLSRGFKQRVGIAQAIVHKPSIVILDEPTIGLDPQSVVEIRNLILKLKGQHTILLSSHLLHEMSLVCDEVTILSKGVVLESGSIENIQSKISQRFKINISTQRYSFEFETFLNQLEGAESVKVFKDEVGENKFQVSLSNHKEQRPLIAAEVYKQELGLLEMSQEAISLEDIFMKVTSNL